MQGIIKQGDCLSLLSELNNESIDLVVTDPPYCIGATSNGQKGTWQDNNLIAPFLKLYFEEIARVLKPGAAFYINTDWRTYPLFYPIIIDVMMVKNCIVWDHGWIKAGNHYRHRHELIIYGTNGDAKRQFPASEPDVWNNKPVNFTKPRHHPAEKPIELVERMIRNSSQPGDTVLDTFVGSGTTALACRSLGRNFVGFEINPANITIAAERLRSQTMEVSWVDD